MQEAWLDSDESQTGTPAVISNVNLPAVQCGPFQSLSLGDRCTPNP